MRARFVNVDRNTPLLFPADLREWFPEDHLVHFIIEAVERLELSGFKVNDTWSGQNPPDMMVMLPLYCYATGLMSSRVIEAAAYTDVVAVNFCAYLKAGIIRVIS
jgi:transposase